VLALLLVAAAGLGVWLLRQAKPHSITGSASTDFVTTSAPAPPRPPKIATAEPWPTYGFDNQRTHLASEASLRPPFKRVWTFRSRGLVEFPPSVAYGNVYVPVERGELVALSAKTGRVVWRHGYRACIASSPALADGVLYETMMNPCSASHDTRGVKGIAVALDARTGKELWRIHPGVSESSPLVVGNLVYFGARDKKVYAVYARTGRIRWTFQTGGAVKGAPAFSDGTIFIGSYDGHLYALDASTGKLRWRAGGENNLLRGRGTFYATPTVAYGRIFVGSTDRAVYAFGASEGALLWARPTGGYVYSSAAVWERTIYVGSYDKRFYALDAATGKVKWRFRADGRISGSPTVMDGVVYFSTFAHTTFGVNARTGRQVWRFKDGEYSPLVAEADRAYLVGRGRIYALEPRK
jgi:outer membrane protein assembly factor BamB